MLTECQDCNHKFYLQGTDLDNIVSGGGCPSCGSHNLYRTQVPPTESEMELRNMVDPSTGQDMGGNPLQEGILADNGWQPRDKRDESFASVRTAEFNMDFNFGDDPRQETHKFIVLRNGTVHSMPTPPGVETHHEDIADRERLHELGYPTGMSLGIKHDDGSTSFLQHDTPLGAGQIAERLESHFGEPITVDPTLKPTTNEERWGLLDRPRAPSGRPLTEMERLYGPASVRKNWSPGLYQQNEGLIRGGSVDETFNMEPYMPWEHLAEAVGGTTAVVTPGAYGIHAGPVHWLQFFGASVDGLDARTEGQEIIRRFGLKNSPEFGKPVTVSVHFPEHLPAAVEVIQTSADGNRPTPLVKEIGAGLKAGTVPFPPGMSPENMRGSAVKTAFLPMLLGLAGEALGGLGGRAIAGNLMKGALMGTGSHMVQGLLGGGQQQGQAAAPPVAQQPEQLPPVVTRTADLETPSSVPSVGAMADDPERVDQKELNDGEQLEQLQGGDQGAGGSLSPDTVEEFSQLLPRILHYYNLDESAANDPVLKALHEKIEAESPGYLDTPDDDETVQKLLAELRQPHDHITAAGEYGVPSANGMVPQTGVSPMGAPQQLAPQQSPTCPYCGGVRRGDGSCPQCGATASPQGGALPGTLPPTGTTHPSFPPTQAAASHQGPANPEQLKAVAEFLIAQNRAEEIPHMIEAPWEYAEELAQIQNKPNDPPTPDESPAPQPAIEEAPPGATMPVADPSQQVAAAVARFSADSITPRCPECGSATTGLLNVDGDARCHACGNTWRIKGGIKDKVAERHDHTELHGHPRVEGVPAADQQGQRDIEQEQDSSLSWQTTAGEPLQVGSEYEMHSADYDVPDIVRITAVKPDSIEFEITGEYDLGHRTEVRREEAEEEGLTFEPVEAGDKDDAGEDGNDYLNDVTNAPRQNTVPTPATSTPFTTSVKESAPLKPEVEEYFEDRIQEYADADPFHGDRSQAQETNEQGDFRIDDKWYDGADGDLLPVEAAVEEEEELRCPNCTSLHVASQMSSPTTTMHDCHRCGHFWEEHDSEEQGEGDHARDWLLNDDSIGSDFGGAPHAYAAGAQQSNGRSRNLHEIAAKTAGKKFTPLEQRGFIDEEGEARNADRLNLEGTHYKVREDWTGKANGGNAPDEHLVLGL